MEGVQRDKKLEREGEKEGGKKREEGREEKENGTGNVAKYYSSYTLAIFLKVGNDNKINNGRREAVKSLARCEVSD